MDKILTSSSRLVMLKYRSWLLRTMDTVVYSPFYLLGFSDQNQIRKIQLFNNYNENAYKPTTRITIDIDNVNIQIYSARLVLHVQLKGMRYYMYYWPIITALVSVAFIWGLTFGILSMSYLALKPSSRDGSEVVPAPEAHETGEREGIPDEAALAPTVSEASLGSVERAPTQHDNHTHVRVLGVTTLDASDMTSNEAVVRRRNHQAEQPST